MLVEETAVRQMLRAMGKPEHKWTRARLLVKLEKDRFTELVASATALAEQADLDLLNSITEALNEGETITLKEEVKETVEESQEAVPEIQEEAAEHSNGESTTKKGRKVKAPKGKKPGKVKAEKSEGNGQEPAKKGKKPGKRELEGPSNKEIVYKAWMKSKKKADPAELWNRVEQKVKDTTIKGWISNWNHGRNLPACAKTK